MGKRLGVWGLGRELEAGFGGLGKELGAGSAGWVAAPLLLNSHSCPWWKSLLAPPWAGISLTESARLETISAARGKECYSTLASALIKAHSGAVSHVRLKEPSSSILG